VGEAPVTLADVALVLAALSVVASLVHDLLD
jgi:hypothetical protein